MRSLGEKRPGVPLQRLFKAVLKPKGHDFGDVQGSKDSKAFFSSLFLSLLGRGATRRVPDGLGPSRPATSSFSQFMSQVFLEGGVASARCGTEGRQCDSEGFRALAMLLACSFAMFRLLFASILSDSWTFSSSPRRLPRSGPSPASVVEWPRASRSNSRPQETLKPNLVL